MEYRLTLPPTFTAQPYLPFYFHSLLFLEYRMVLYPNFIKRVYMDPEAVIQKILQTQ